MGENRAELTLPLAEDTAPSAVSTPSAAPTLGSRVGRYVLTEELGRGGMGTVYGAHDPELDRPLAIKLLHRPWPGDSSGELRSRLRREAQALARLNHPNVVAVYEVGEHDGLVFIAMERVRGETLGSWLRTQRSPAQVLDAMVAAGSGLAAAHAEGLVHRDFKPANVMVGEDGRVRVLDFGLARGLHEMGASTDESMTRSGELLESFGSGSMSGLLAERLTADGTVMGTPTYMAPEQLHGKGCDARADQYAFCVALYEGLYGRPPFEARKIKALAKLKQQARFGRRPRGVGPRGIWPVLVRGLAPEADDRWPSMRELLDALERKRRPLRARTVVAAATVVLVGGAAAAFSADTREGPQCDDASAAAFEGVWDDSRRSAVASAITATRVPYAETTWNTVEERLDGFARDWTELRAGTCEAARTETLAPADLDARMHCLDEQLGRARAMVDVLADADDATTRRAVKLVSRLPGPAVCERVATLAQQPEDPAIAQRVKEIEIDLIALDATIDAGRFEAAEAGVADAIARARTTGFGPVLGKALDVGGQLDVDRGRYEQASSKFEEAFWLAREAGDDVLAAGAAARLVYVVGDNLSRFDDAMTWARHGEGLLGRLGTHPGVEGALRAAIGNVLQKQGKSAEAIEQLERVLELRTEQYGRNHHDVGAVLMGLGNARLDQAEHALAKRHFQDALTIYEHQLGSHHPDVAEAIASVGNVFMHNGEIEAALRHYERAYARGRVALGENHPVTAGMLANVGMAREQIGKYDQAAEAYEASLAILEENLGADHPSVATVLHNLGGLRRIQGRHDEAVATLERALNLFLSTLGSEHPHISASRINLGLALVDQGRPQRAIPHFEKALAVAETSHDGVHPDEAKCHHMLGVAHAASGDVKQALHEQQRALTLWEQTLGTDHAEYVVTLTALGEAQLETGSAPEAITTLRHASELAGAVDIAEDGRAAAWLALAQALQSQSPRSPEAKELARKALAAFEAADAPFTEHRALATAVLEG